MGMSNKFGPMVVTTGNKSEMAVGYATLYGDMCGGFNPIKDIYKSKLFEICEWRNNNNLNDLLGGERPIPSNILKKPPSAELRPDQKDSDSLPDYKVLDDILFGLIELELTVEEIVQRGHTLEEVKRIQHLLYVAEYKRRQAPPGVKIGTKNFGKDRRYPITNGYRDK
jgi:NAD+ synthase